MNTTYAKAINDALMEEMERDENVIVFGEDVAQFGGIFGATRGLLEIDFHPAWLLMNLALVLAEIYLLISWEHWVIPVTLLVVLIIAVNIREVWSMLQKLLSKFKRTK